MFTGNSHKVLYEGINNIQSKHREKKKQYIKKNNTMHNLFNSGVKSTGKSDATAS